MLYSVVKEIQRINKKELELSLDKKLSWHDEYRDSAYIFVGKQTIRCIHYPRVCYNITCTLFLGGLDYDLTEGDVLSVFSQLVYNFFIVRNNLHVFFIRYGEIVNINLVRDKRTKKSKGFCFLAYEDQRSTVLAVDNLNGIKVSTVLSPHFLL